MFKLLILVVLAFIATITNATNPSPANPSPATIPANPSPANPAPFIGYREMWLNRNCSGPSEGVGAIVTNVCFPVRDGDYSKKYYLDAAKKRINYAYYTDSKCKDNAETHIFINITGGCIQENDPEIGDFSFKIFNVTKEQDLYSKYAGRNSIIVYGYGFVNCNGTSPTSISLNFMEGCMPQGNDPNAPPDTPPTFAIYNISATGLKNSLFSNSKCEGTPDRTEMVYEQMEFNQCFLNDGDVMEEDSKSTRTITSFMIGKPIPTRTLFPYVLTENFVSPDCTGPTKEAHIDVSGLCDIRYDYTAAPTSQNPNNYNKTRAPGSFKVSGEGVNRYREEFSDDNCQFPTGSKFSDGQLGICMPVSDPSSQVKSSKITGITNLNDVFGKFVGYLTNFNYLGKDCNGGLASLTVQDTSNTCYPGSSSSGAALYYKQSCNATSLLFATYSENTCDNSQVQSVSARPPSCYNNSPQDMEGVAQSSKTTCMVSPATNPNPTPVQQPTTKPAPTPTKNSPTKNSPTKNSPTKNSPTKNSPTKPKSPVKTPTKPKSPVKTPTKPKSPVKTPTKPKAPVKTPTKPKAPVKTPTKPNNQQ